MDPSPGRRRCTVAGRLGGSERRFRNLWGADEDQTDITSSRLNPMNSNLMRRPSARAVRSGDQPGRRGCRWSACGAKPSH